MKKNLKAAVLVLAAMLGASAVPQANAGLITKDVFGQTNIDSLINLTLDANNYRIIINSGFDFDQFYVPFGSSQDLEKVSFSLDGWSCLTSGNYFVCDSLNGLKNSILADIKINNGYSFSDFIDSRDLFYTANASDFESFFANENGYSNYVPNIVKQQTPSNSVPEPSTLAIFALGMIGLASRRLKKQS